MQKAIGHVEDLDPAVNASYFVSIDGEQAALFNAFKSTQEFLPSRTIENVHTIMVNHRDYKVATSGYLVQANLSLECLRSSRGTYDGTPPGWRTGDRPGFRHNKVVFLSPMIFNPLILNHYYPSGNIDFSPAFNQPRPDRIIKIPINMIRIDGFTDMRTPIFRTPSFQSPPHPPYEGRGNFPPAPAFDIYLDPEPQGNNNQSSSSTVSMPPSEVSSTLVSGNMRGARSLPTVSDEFDPSATSTRTPQGSAQMDPYADPQPGTSSSGNADELPPLITPKKRGKSSRKSSGADKSPRKSVKRTPKKSPGKSPRKSPKSGLKKTPSQPMITSFIPKRKDRPSPTGAAPKAKKTKRILGDLSVEERQEAASLENSLMRDDAAIKEATVDPETLSSSTQGRGTLQEEDPSVADASIDGANLFPTPEMTPEVTPENDNSPTPAPSPGNMTWPSKSDFNISPPEDNSISNIKPLELSKSSEEQRGSSGGTSNELGKFEDYQEESDDPPQDPPQEEANQNPHEEVNQIQPDHDEHIVFNIANTVVANANLDDAPRATANPATPEHMLIVVEDDNTITHLLRFDQRHSPSDILDAFWNRSLHMMLPDEGFEASVTSPPPPPPPTPSSSTEAVKGSPGTSNVSSDTNDVSTGLQVTFVGIPGGTDPMILNRSDMPVGNIETEDVDGEEEDTRGEKEKGKGKKKKGHAN